MPSTEVDKLAERIARIGDRVSHVVALASPSPDLMRANEGAYAALGTLLAAHASKPYYDGADNCGHPEPAESSISEHDAWSDDHPVGAGDVGRICLLTQTGSFCPACTETAYGDEDPAGGDYVSAPCGFRKIIAGCLTRTIDAAAIDAAAGKGKP